MATIQIPVPLFNGAALATVVTKPVCKVSYNGAEATIVPGASVVITDGCAWVPADPANGNIMVTAAAVATQNDANGVAVLSTAHTIAVNLDSKVSETAKANVALKASDLYPLAKTDTEMLLDPEYDPAKTAAQAGEGLTLTEHNALLDIEGRVPAGEIGTPGGTLASKADASGGSTGGYTEDDRVRDDAVATRVNTLPTLEDIENGEVSQDVVEMLENIDDRVPTADKLTPEGQIASVADAGGGGSVDPLNKPVPGGYPQGTAGHVLGQIYVKQISVLNPIVAGEQQVLITQGASYLRPSNAILVNGTLGIDLTLADTITWMIGEDELPGFIAGPQTFGLELTSQETEEFSVGGHNLTAFAVMGTQRVAIFKGSLVVQAVV